jgi:hypothetical protein
VGLRNGCPVFIVHILSKSGDPTGQTMGIPSGKHTKNDGKSPFLMGK